VSLSCRDRLAGDGQPRSRRRAASTSDAGGLAAGSPGAQQWTNVCEEARYTWRLLSDLAQGTASGRQAPFPKPYRLVVFGFRQRLAVRTPHLLRGISMRVPPDEISAPGSTARRFGSSRQPCRCCNHPAMRCALALKTNELTVLGHRNLRASDVAVLAHIESELTRVERHFRAAPALPATANRSTTTGGHSAAQRVTR